jgi:WD40 repeat protein
VSIYRTNVETGETVAILHSDDLFSSRVSPDGRYIAALRNDQTGLMLFDVSTGQWSSLTRGGQLSYNDWSHDGNFVYLRENHAGAAEVVRVRVKDHSKEKVVDLRDFPQLTDMFAGWIGLTPNDDLLLLRDRSLQEIYALDLEFH